MLLDILANPYFYAVAIPAVVLTGLAKGGFTGLGMMGAPLLSLVLPPTQAAAVLLPILIVQDVVSVWAFWRDFDRKQLIILLIGGVIGVAGGFVYAAQVSQPAVKLALGLISGGFAAHRLWIERHGAIVAPSNAPPIVGVGFGAFAGFTSQIAHAGGPPVQMYLMPRQMPRDTFVGTMAIFFALINWVKVPAYVALGQFTHTNLLISAAMLPVALASTIFGVWFVRRIDGAAFTRAVYWLMIAVGLKLAWDGAAALWF